MDLTAVRTALRTASNLATKYSPQILSGVAVAGVVSTAVFSHKAGELAVHHIYDEQEQCEVKLSVEGYIRTNWRLYVPVVLSAGGAIACIIASTTVSSRRSTALAAAYQLSRDAYTAYQDEVRTIIGEDKERDIRAKVAEQSQPVGVSTSAVVVGDGDVLCFDEYSGRYFKSSLERLRKVINDINYDLTRFDAVSLNDLYSHLGLAQTAMGDELGWNSGALIEVEFLTVLSPEGVPAISLHLHTPPVTDWYRLG